MRMIPQPEQAVHLIPENEVAEILERESPFHGSIPAKSDILAYLTKVNGALIERREERKILYEKYVTATAMYACARHIMHLHLPEKLLATFTIIAGRKPYHVHDPLEIILVRSRESDEQYIIKPLNVQLVDIEEEMPHDKRAAFTTSELIRERLARKLNEVANRLQHERTYDARDHLLFVSIRDICFPLFGIGQRGKKYAQEYHSLSVYLQQHYGHFKLKVPLCLALSDDEFPEAA